MTLADVLSVSSTDGKYEFSIITKDTLPSALSVIKEAFFVDESVCIATKVPQNPQAIEELTELCIRAANDGVSLIAIEKATGKAVSAYFNKIQVAANADEDNYFEQFEAKCMHASSRALMRFMIEMEKLYDIFAEKQVTCGLEIMFIGTLREHRGRQLGSQMWQLSMDIARRLRQGENVKISPKDNSVLPLEPVPECVMALATSNATVRIAEKCKFDVLLEERFAKFSFDGKTFAERIGPETETAKLIFKDLRQE